jgi:hypothetical protein
MYYIPAYQIIVRFPLGITADEKLALKSNVQEWFEQE